MKTISHTKTFEMPVPVAELFPLFSPEGETYWVPGWDYENVMGTTELSEDYVFLTKSHDHASTDAIWIIKAYDPQNHFIQFYKIEPHEKIGLISVKCKKMGAERTHLQITYKYRALSASGEAFIAGFDGAAYEEFIDAWQRLLWKYFDAKNRKKYHERA